MSDDDSFTGRMRRYARVGGAMGGLAARLAGERYLGLPIDRERHAADLKAALGGIKGPLMKVAQLLATIPDALPEEYVRELIQLQANAPAMGWPFVRRRMMGELGPDWPGRFASFEHEAARAASLGQVHRAVALDGTPLACKLQYPEMASAVEADLRQLKLAMGLYERYDRTVSAPPRSMPRSPTGCARNWIICARPRICGSTARFCRTSPGSPCRARYRSCRPGGS